MNDFPGLHYVDFSLPVVWAALLALAVLLYVVLDGFDLGVGILFPLFPDEALRDRMMNAVAPYWDGNETWLVLGGAGLWVAFPRAYAVIMPALYLPVILMLLALILRGVAFEFRWAAKPRHRAWDLAFAGGSILAAFSQGLVLGGLLQGIHIEQGRFAGGPFDWLTPFSVLCGAALVSGYGLLGASWLILKTSGPLEHGCRRIAQVLLVLVLACMAIVSICTPLMLPHVATRWFTMPGLWWLTPVPLLTATAAWQCWRGLRAGDALRPFAAAVCLFALGFAGLVISNIPWLVPPVLDVWQCAAAPASQLFMLVGTLVLLPLILTYTAFVYWVFRGKLPESGEGHYGH